MKKIHADKGKNAAESIRSIENREEKDRSILKIGENLFFLANFFVTKTKKMVQMHQKKFFCGESLKI